MASVTRTVPGTEIGTSVMPLARRCRQFRYPVPCLLLVPCVLLLAGCVQQRIVIRSNPPGARAFLNGALVGETPVTTNFDWYTNYQIHVERAGYLPVDAREAVRSPWYMWIPIDAVSEALPWRIVDERQFAYDLAPAPDDVGPPLWSVERSQEAVAPGAAKAPAAATTAGSTPR